MRKKENTKKPDFHHEGHEDHEELQEFKIFSPSCPSCSSWFIWDFAKMMTAYAAIKVSSLIGPAVFWPEASLV